RPAYGGARDGRGEGRKEGNDEARFADDGRRVRGVHPGGTSGDAGARTGAQALPGPRRQVGRGERGPREDRRDAAAGSSDGKTPSCDPHGRRAGPGAENLVRDARLCEGRQGRLLLPEWSEVQVEVCDARLQRRGEP